MKDDARVKVPQADGEIVICVNGDEPTTYAVTDGHVTVKQEDVEGFLARVDGSSVASGSPAGSTQKEK